MSFNNLWTKYKLYFYHEFIDNPDFPATKAELLQTDLGHYYISNDFTIYQKKDQADTAITKHDYYNNYGTVMIMLENMPTFKATDFIEFHYAQYSQPKLDFLRNVIAEFKGMKFHKGGVEVPPSQPFQIILKWCIEKLEEMENEYTPKKRNNKTFVNISRISELKKINSSSFDLTKLIKTLEEINDNYAISNFLSVAMLGRSVLDHIPPIFGLLTFNEVANNYGNVSFKKNMGHLNTSMRSIADNYLHNTIRIKESLPNENQVDFSRELDFLLGEIVRML